MKLILALALAAAPTAAAPLPELPDIMPACRETLKAVLHGDREWLPRHMAEIKASEEAQGRYYAICAIYMRGALDLVEIEAEAKAPRA